MQIKKYEKFYFQLNLEFNCIIKLNNISCAELFYNYFHKLPRFVSLLLYLC